MKRCRQLHVAGRYARLPVDHPDVASGDESVASENEVVFGIPHKELTAGGIHDIEVVDITGFSGAASGRTECYLAQTSDLAHDVRGFPTVDDIYFVAALVG